MDANTSREIVFELEKKNHIPERDAQFGLRGGKNRKISENSLVPSAEGQVS